MAKEIQQKNMRCKRCVSWIYEHIIKVFFKNVLEAIIYFILFTTIIAAGYCIMGKWEEFWGFVVNLFKIAPIIGGIGLTLILIAIFQYRLSVKYTIDKNYWTLFLYVLIAMIFFIFTFRDIGMIGYSYIVGTPTAIATIAEPTITSTVEVVPTLTSKEIVEKRVREYISCLSDDDKIFLAWDMLHFKYQQYWAGDLGGDGKVKFVSGWKLVTLEIAEIVNTHVEETLAEVILDLDYSNNSYDGTYKICLEYNNDKDEWLIYRHLENELGECTFNYDR